MWAPAEHLVISAEDRRLLETWTRAHSAPQSVAMRCQVILLAADGVANNAIAKELGISRPTVLLWRNRFAAGGPQALVAVVCQAYVEGVSTRRVDDLGFAAEVLGHGDALDEHQYKPQDDHEQRNDDRGADAQERR